MVIDAHNHFWQYDKVKQPWINEDMAVLKKRFSALHGNITGSIWQQ